MKGSDDATVPFSRTSAVEHMENEVEVGPEKKAANNGETNVSLPRPPRHCLQVWGEEIVGVCTILGRMEFEFTKQYTHSDQTL